MHRPNASQPDQRIVREIERMFAARMREHRQARGLSQAKFANLVLDQIGLKLDPSAITRIERNAEDPDGARSISLTEAVAIASALRFSLDDLAKFDISLSLSDAEHRYEAAQAAAMDAQEKAARAHADLERIRAQYESRQRKAELAREIAALQAQEEHLDQEVQTYSFQQVDNDVEIKRDAYKRAAAARDDLKAVRLEIRKLADELVQLGGSE